MGAQEGSAYNGHFESVCYHPLFLFNEHGDCVAATLRPGNVHSADDWEDLLLPEIERQQAEGKRVAFRADAAFAKPEIYDALETRDVDYAIRMPANAVRLQLSVLAYNLGNLWRRLVLPPRGQALVAHESPAAASKNWGLAGEACQVLLAPAGGRASDPAALRRDAAEDLGAAGAGRLTRDRVQRRLAKKGHKCGAVSEKCPESSGSGRFHVSVG